MKSRAPRHLYPFWQAALAILASLLFMAPATAFAEDASTSKTLWMASAEVGIGPIGDDVFLHLTPGVTALRPMPLFRCDGSGDECRVLSRLSLHVPLRLRIADGEPETGEVFRREDWHEASDFFRILRRLEYGTFDDPIHLRAGELHSATLGQGTIVGGYYNVITTDHYRLGLQADVEEERWGSELLVNDLTNPNLVGLRAHAKLPYLYDEDHDWRQFTLGASAVTDFTAPTSLVLDEDQSTAAGPDLRPAVQQRQATTLAGADLRWRAIGGESGSLTPYVDFNHHFDIGSGIHSGVLWRQNIGHDIRLTSRLEYRHLRDRYLPHYFDPLYEVTRYQHPPLDDPDLPGPKLTAAASAEPSTRHGGYGEVQARIKEDLTLFAAYSDGSGTTPVDLRLRADYELRERARVGLFYYRAVHGDLDFGDTMAELFDLDGALGAVEARATLWRHIYAHGQFARMWRLHDDGDFESVHLFNIGVGAGATF